MKKKISFKCISNCSCNSNYCIRIYHKGKIIYNGCIDDTNEITLCFLLFRCYTVIIQNCNKLIPMTYILNLCPTNICYQKFLKKEEVLLFPVLLQAFQKIFLLF